MKLIVVLYVLEVSITGQVRETRIVEPDMATCQQHMKQMEYTHEGAFFDCEYLDASEIGK
jgi:hypothetical protein